MSRVRAAFFWILLLSAMTIPVGAAAVSPLLAWRDPIYIAAGFSGVIALTLLLVQPLLAAGCLPGVHSMQGRHLHGWVGGALVLFVVIHVAGLWITSPPDVIDALLFISPTPFSVWGVLAMWGLFATAALAVLRRRLRLRAGTWRLSHKTLAAIIVVGTVLHTIMIEGTMELLSKSVLCCLVFVATVIALVRV